MVEGDPKKSWSGIEAEGRVEQECVGLKEEASLRHQYSDQRFSQIRVPCMASTAAGTEEVEEQMARLSA